MAIAAFDTVAAPNVETLPAVAKRCARSGSNGTLLRCGETLLGQLIRSLPSPAPLWCHTELC